MSLGAPNRKPGSTSRSPAHLLCAHAGGLCVALGGVSTDLPSVQPMHSFLGTFIQQLFVLQPLDSARHCLHVAATALSRTGSYERRILIS